MLFTGTFVETSMQVVYNAADANEAHILAGFLESQGINAHVSGHYLQGGVGELAPTDLAKIFVADDDIESARALVESYQNAPHNALEGSTETDAEHTEPSSPGSSRALLIAVGFAVIVSLAYLLSWA